MSDDRRPFKDDDPTAIHRPVGGDGGEWESTRVHTSVGEDPAEPAASAPRATKRDPGIIAPLVTVALISLLVGLGLGYLLFSDDDVVAPPPGSATTVPALLDQPATTLRPTSTPSTVVSTTASAARVTTTSARTATTAAPTTVTTIASSPSTEPGGTVDPEVRVPLRPAPAA